MRKKEQIEKYCAVCGSVFYVSKYREKTARYCSRKCSNVDSERKAERIKNAKNGFCKHNKENGPWNKGFTKETHPQLACPGNGKNFGIPWAKGKSKKTDKRLAKLSIKNSKIIQGMYDRGEIDLSKRKTDYKALGQKVSNTISKMLANGTLKNQFRFRKGWYTKLDGTKEFYESSYEKKYMEIMDSKGVEWTKKHGIRIQYLDPTTRTNRYYVPDFLVNGIELHEVKPKKQTTLPKILAKTKAAKKYCLTNKMKYNIITEKNLDL